MLKKLKLLAVALWVAFALAVSCALFAPGTSASGSPRGQQQQQQQRQQPSTQQPTNAPATPAASQAQQQQQPASGNNNSGGLTASERRGKAIYLRGESTSGREITAIVGEVDVPASTVTCAGCHGARGEGKTEGGVTAGALMWSHLIKSYGHTHPTGRKHGPFNETLFARATTQGLDPDGNELLVAMPRYRMAAEDLVDLIAYIKRIENDRDPGLTDTSLKVGTLLPTRGALADSGAAMRDVLNAYFQDLNSRGGIYNRKVELEVVETGADAAATAENVRRLLDEGQVFSLVSGMSAGADRELAALTQEREVPFIGPTTLLPLTGFQKNRYIFYLLPGMTEQARALAAFAGRRQPLAASLIAVINPETEIAVAAASAIEEEIKKQGAGSVQKVAYQRGKFDAAATVASLKGREVVFFLGSNGEDVSFIKEAAAQGWTPTVLLLGTFVSRDLQDAIPLSFKDRVFLAFPTVPSDITPAGTAEFRALAEKYKFAIRHTAAQLSALAAAKTLVEGLKRAGKDLSRERLITALEGLYDFETGVTPRLTFGPNRRVGAAGAHIVSIDPATKQFVVSSDWIKVN
ncbi:MAG TPA: ABC transporter substrate-binding protein [Pyrinomonadaceae bacterium]|nr:ABC transporter substrate-binding protein [Pyrinomonadaceae bacterium]